MGTVVLKPKCDICLDSTLLQRPGGLTDCRCWKNKTMFDQFPNTTQQVRRAVDRFNLRQVEWDWQSFEVMRFLIHGTSQMPITSAYIEELLSVDRRTVARLIALLKQDWRLPIVSRRKEPNGYWLAQTLVEFEENERPFRNQALTTLKLSWKVRKANFPEFAGQEFFDFVFEQDGKDSADAA